MIVREGGVWQNHVRTHARTYPRKKTKVSENKAKRENENKAKGIKWRDIRSWKKHFNRLKCGLECWKEKKEMKKKTKKNYVRESCPRSQRNCFCEWVLVAKLPYIWGYRGQAGVRELIPLFTHDQQSTLNYYSEIKGSFVMVIGKGPYLLWKSTPFLTDVQCSFFNWCTVRTRRGFLKTSKEFSRQESVFSYPFLTIWGSFCAK